MALIVDNRIGSVALYKPLLKCGVDAELTRLEFADVAFVGKGAAETNLDIGIELKTIMDLIGSIRSGRLAGHQLPGLLQTYDYSFLIVEGFWRHDDRGMVCSYQGKSRGWQPLPGRMTASELEKTVLTLELCGGLHVRYVNTRRDTLRFIATLYRWFTDTALDRHTSHLTLHQQPTLLPVSDFRRTVCSFPGIGLRTSLAVERHFEGSLVRGANATEEEWAGISTNDDKGTSRRLGTKTAQRIVEFLKGTP